MLGKLNRRRVRIGLRGKLHRSEENLNEATLVHLQLSNCEDGSGDKRGGVERAVSLIDLPFHASTAQLSSLIIYVHQISYRIRTNLLYQYHLLLSFSPFNMSKNCRNKRYFSNRPNYFENSLHFRTNHAKAVIHSVFAM